VLQVLPFCSDETLDQLEQNLTGMPSMTQLLNAGLSPEQITDKILEGLGSSRSGDSIVPRYVTATGILATGSCHLCVMCMASSEDAVPMPYCKMIVWFVHRAASACF
jgi:hypothetical protein